MEDVAILSTAYWGPIYYFSCFAKYQNVKLEAHEIYQKQSYRNRCEIYGPNDMQSLQVPVLRGSFHKTLIKDLQIAYDTAWQKNHLKSIEAAYRSSPYYEYYIDDVLPFYTKQYKFLWDYNHSITQICLRWMKLNTRLGETNDYIKDYAFGDLRDKIHPKIPVNEVDQDFVPQPYTEGFENRHGFIPNLSILDLMFNCGPDAKQIIDMSIIK